MTKLSRLPGALALTLVAAQPAVAASQAVPPAATTQSRADTTEGRRGPLGGTPFVLVAAAIAAVAIIIIATTGDSRPDSR